jgi:hypothetical protein
LVGQILPPRAMPFYGYEVRNNETKNIIVTFCGFFKLKIDLKQYNPTLLYLFYKRKISKLKKTLLRQLLMLLFLGKNINSTTKTPSLNITFLLVLWRKFLPSTFQTT